MAEPLTEERLAEIERQHVADQLLRSRVRRTRDTNASDLSEAFFFADNARSLLLVEVRRLQRVCREQEQRMEAAMAIPERDAGEAAPWPADHGAALAWNNALRRVRSVLSSGGE